MKKQLILLPHVMEEIKANYYLSLKTEQEDFYDFLNRQLNPHTRGLITRQLGDRIKVFSEHFSLICVKANEGESIKAINIKKTEKFQFDFVLERGYILQGEWEFASIGDAKQLAHNEDTDENDSLQDEIEQIRHNHLKAKEFAEFEEYWKQLDVINQLTAESSHEKKKKSVTPYSKLIVDYDQNLVKLKLTKKGYYFQNNSKIRICTLDAWKSHYEINQINNLDKVHSRNIGSVKSYKERNDSLEIEVYSSDILKDLVKDKAYSEGMVWVDDQGTKSVISRQRQALQQLFNRESSNKQLKDFIPEADLLSPMNTDMELDQDLLSEKYFEFTDSQKAAVKGALSENDLYLIQGPPGTGKTTVISEIISYLIKSEKKVLLSSQTNLAVDNVLQRIGNQEYVNAIRIGNEEKFELDSGNFSLTNRVTDLQSSMINKLINRNEEIKKLEVQISSISPVLKAHQEMERNIKRIVNTNTNLLNKLIEKERIEASMKAKQVLLRLVEEKIMEFEGKHEADVSDLDKIYNFILSSNYSIEDAVEQAALVQGVLIEQEDQYSINIYQQMVNEIISITEDMEQVDQSLNGILTHSNELLQEMKVVDDRLAAIKNSVVNGRLPKPLYSEAKSLNENSDLITMQLKEDNFRANGYKQKKEQLNDDLTMLLSEVEEHRLVVEKYIWQHHAIWEKLYGKNTLKKGEFLEIAGKMREFEKKYGHLRELFGLFPYVSLYSAYQDHKQKHVTVLEELEAVTEQVQQIDKYISAYNSSIHSFQEEDYVKGYLGYYEMTIKELDLNTELNRIATFTKQIEQDRAKIHLHNRSKEIQVDWEHQLQLYQECFEDVYIHMSNLICATCLGISATKNNHFNSTEFDYVIIDEAARSSSLELLIPMTRGKKIVLVGDHKQLSPHVDNVIMKRAEKKENFSDDDIDALFKQSLFGIMYRRIDDKLKTFLDEQFRMHNGISSVVSKYFYNSQLRDHKTIFNKAHSLEDSIPKGFYWLDTSSMGEATMEKEDGTSYYNQGEIQVTIQTLLRLNNHLKLPKEVGIIAPYSSQKQKLEEAIRNHTFEKLDIEINTIDAFQGREKNIILFTLVRNNENQSVGHTANYARINVAISRAQELLLIIGSSKFVTDNQKKSPKLYKVVQHLDKTDAKIDQNKFLLEGVTHES